MGSVLWLFVSLICGAIAAAIASSKGRHGVGWFFIGFFFGLIGIIIALVLSDLKQEKRRFDEITADRRRLKEQLRQERLKSESFRRYATQRIDSHDRVLGVDTKSAVSLGVGGAPPLPPLPRVDGFELEPDDADVGEDVPVSEAPAEPTWHYERDGTPHGPVPASEVRSLLRSGALSPRSLLWNESLDSWTPARDLPAFRGMGPA